MTGKTCFKCAVRKPLSEFYKHARMADGHLNKCKSCAKNDVGTNYRDNREYYQKYDKARALRPDRVEARGKYAQTEQGRERGAAAKRAWINRNPVARNAHNEVSKALQSGRLVRGPCSVCGVTKRVHAHHEDYLKPLEVTWLCPRHHKDHHENNV